MLENDIVKPIINIFMIMILLKKRIISIIMIQIIYMEEQWENLYHMEDLDGLVLLINVLNKPDNSIHGYFAEVDMYHPDELHDYQNDFRKAPEKIYITEDSLSEDQINTAKKYNIKRGASKKLVPKLYPKKNYVVHYRNLKYYLANGWKLTKVHRILEFKQSLWMKIYIDFNTRKRQEATTKSPKDFFKLMNNSAYGKTIEDKRKRIKLRAVTNEKDFIKYDSRPTFIGYKKYGKDFYEIHERPTEIKLDKPIYVGHAVLYLSKLTIYKFWYDFLK